MSVSLFLQSEDGPSAVEYAVMLALILVVCLATITLIGQRSSEMYNMIANSLQSVGS